MKQCELCRSAATTYCDSDQAYLCSICDYKVHSANFLVARHSRTILCHVCNTPTTACNRCRDFAIDVEESVGRSDEDAKAVPWSLNLNAPPPATSSSSSDCESSSSSTPLRRDRSRRKTTDLRFKMENTSRYSSGGIVAVKASPATGGGGRVKNLKRRRLPRSGRVGFAMLDVGEVARCQVAVVADLLKVREVPLADSHCSIKK